MHRQAHWQAAYANSALETLGWHEPFPEASLEFVSAVAPPGARVVDVGGGASRLVDHLLARGYRPAVLDFAAMALEKTRQRLGPSSDAVRWIAADVLGEIELGAFDVWHDRAAFHFLTEPADRRRYAGLAARSVVPGGHLVIGTFALDGPPRCSGLAVRRYDAETLAAEFAPEFVPATARRCLHRTPSGSEQAFLFATMKRSPNAVPNFGDSGSM